MINHLDTSIVATIARREAGLSIKSLGTHLILLALALGMVLLSRTALTPSEDLFSGQAGEVVVSLFLFVALPIVVMMNSTLAGASIADDRDKKVAEILLSAARPEEIYVGKLLGHSLVGTGQIILLWGVVVTSLFSLTLGQGGGEFPWLAASLVLLFFLPGYFLFTALHTIAGVLVNRNEDYMFTQIPILFLLLLSLCIPFAPMLGWGSLTEGWIVALSWLPPLSMGTAPLTYLAGNTLPWLLILSWVMLVLAALSLIALGSRIFRRRILL